MRFSEAVPPPAYGATPESRGAAKQVCGGALNVPRGADHPKMARYSDELGRLLVLQTSAVGPNYLLEGRQGGAGLVSPGQHASAAFGDVERFELFTGSRSEKNLYLYQKMGYEIFKRKELSDRVTLVFLEKSADWEG